jgi:hypothetical protein
VDGCVGEISVDDVTAEADTMISYQRRPRMTVPSRLGQSAISPAGLEAYHGLRSIAVHGELAHATAYAAVLMRDGKARRIDEALLLAAAELQRLQHTVEEYAPHREARRILDRVELPPPQSLGLPPTLPPALSTREALA